MALRAAGVAAHRAGEIETARRAYRAALAVAVDADTLYLLGLLEAQQGKVAEALAHLDAAVACLPPTAPARGVATLQKIRGDLAAALGRIDAAAAAYAAAGAADPTAPAPALFEAECRQRSGDLDGAVVALRRAASAAGDDPGIWANLAQLERTRGDGAAAAAAWTRARNLRPDDPDMATAHADLLLEQRREDDADAVTRQALDRHPDRLDLRLQALTLARRALDFAGAAGHADRIVALLDAADDTTLARVGRRTLARALYADILDPWPRALRRRVTRALGTAQARELPLPADAMAARPAVPIPSSRRLRIGYLSEFFGNHPVGHVFSSLPAAHDHDRVDVHVLVAGARGLDDSPYAEAVRRGATSILSVATGPLDGAAARVSALGLDVLIDLDGVMGGRSLDLVSRRLAPVQLFWLGHADTLALPTLDATLGDRVVAAGIAPEDAPLILLGGCYHIAGREPVAATVPDRVACGLPPTGPVFAAFNNPQKIDAEVFADWMEILHAVPGAVLWLTPLGPAARLSARLADLAAAAGIDPRRLVLAPPLEDKRQHLARQSHATILLDTRRLNASTTALDALMTGLPVLTLAGDRWSGRIAASMLAPLGLADLIAPDRASYIRTAVALGRDAVAAGALRNRVRACAQRGSVFEPRGFAARLETALREAIGRRRPAD